MNRHLAVALAAVVISGLFWIDALFIPLVLLGPILTGVLADRRGMRREAVLAWFAAGILALLSDWAINDEDQLFHLLMAVWTAGVTLGAASLHSRAHALRNRIPGLHRQTTGP